MDTSTEIERTFVTASGAMDGWTGHRLRPEDSVERYARGVSGALFSRPWFDRFSLWTLRRWFFPASRLWAAARNAHGSAERFFDAVPMSPLRGDDRRLLTTLAKFEAARAAVNALEFEWQKVFFGPDEVSVDYRVAVESARLDRRHAYNTTRRHFRFLLGNDIPRVKRDTHSPSEAEAVYGAALADRTPYFAVPDPMPNVEVSRPMPGAVGIDYWLRFQSPSDRLGDTVYARVHEPEGVSNPPTLIFGHGVCVEFDHWHGLIDEINALTAMGIRVIRPEAPWHGRRVVPGHYGGERFIATFPYGPLDTFTGALREWTVLADWARRNSTGPLAMGGVSLGALMSQLAGDCAHDWPARLRPDALFLITHCGRMIDAMMRGRLAKVWGDEDAIRAHGWTDELIENYMTVLDPKRPPVVPPERIVSVLGSRDNVTPFDSGLPLVTDWGVPPDNLFVWRRGHFTVPMTMIRNHGPLRRLRAIFDDLST